MKKILLLVLLAFLFSFSHAQNKVKIGKTGAYNMGLVVCVKENGVYQFTFENQNEVQVNDHDDFSINADYFDELFEILMAGFENKPKKDVPISSIKDYVCLDYVKFLGKVRVRFNSSKKKNALGVSYSAWLTQKDIQKLFGK